MIFKKLKIKMKERKYRNYIDTHKAAVQDAFVEMVMCEELKYLWESEDFYNQMVDRIADHDLSKFSDEEFDAYRRYFFPVNEEEKANAKEDFDKAWQHHLKYNDHHWQHRKDNKAFSEKDQLAVLENVCDWLGMGYIFGDRPYEYYEEHKDEIILHKLDKEFLEKVIYALEKDTDSDTYNYGKRKK